MQRLAGDRQGAIRRPIRAVGKEVGWGGDDLVVCVCGCGHSEERGEWLRELSSLGVRVADWRLWGNIAAESSHFPLASCLTSPFLPLPHTVTVGLRI